MKILLTGKHGQVGWELQRTLATLGEVVALDRQTLDLGNPDSIRAAIREVKPGLIVNPAAYTAVDKAESEPELAMAVNGTAPGIMAEEAKKLGAALIHYSTDYVFDGCKTSPYTEDDIPNPINVYGKSKLAGEQAIQAVGVPHLILRTSWVYGMRGKNFLLTVLRLAKERDALKIVDDQIGAPTWSRMIAEASAQIIAQAYAPVSHRPLPIADDSGIYNLTAAGRTSWCGFTRAILENAREGTRVSPIPTTDYPLPAPRPLFSLLASDKLTETFGVKLPSWDDALALCMDREIRAHD
ncbi:MAG: dTDP-4-dehydrorhamnose reductase [Sulfurimicrobium sp.]|nr:dTDP-4-dehydrorhamnose reductase [Sulfurimicrobium sp.]